MLGIAIPEAQGGGGYGFLEAALVLEQIGRTVAPIPYYATVVLGALPIAKFGTDAQKAALLPGVASGETILDRRAHRGRHRSAAPDHDGDAVDGDGWTLDGDEGLRPGRPAGRPACSFPRSPPTARSSSRSSTPAPPGVTRERQDTTNHHAEARLTLKGVKVAAGDVLGSAEQGAEILTWTVERGDRRAVRDRDRHLRGSRAHDRRVHQDA